MKRQNDHIPQRSLTISPAGISSATVGMKAVECLFAVTLAIQPDQNDDSSSFSLIDKSLYKT